MAARLTTGAFALILGCLASLAFAETLPDPTRPPQEAGLTGAVAAVHSGPVLQSVKISPGKRMAVISGQLLTVGDSLGEAELIKITESEAVLSGPEGRQTLALFPDVEKRVAIPPQGQPLKPPGRKSKRRTEQKAP